jgi:hypothetical protein
LLTGLRLENFKSWDDTGQVRLAPFTVFFGRNSSGKSSLLQALLLMKQTTESLDQRQVLNLGGNDALVDLGTFSDVAFRHETTRDVSLAFDWRLPRVLDIAVPVKHRVRADRLSFRATIGVTGSQQRLPEIAVKEMRYVVGTDTATSVGMRRLGPRNYELVTNGLDIALRSGMRTNLPDPVKCYSFPEVATRSFTDSAILLESAGVTSSPLSLSHPHAPGPHERQPAQRQQPHATRTAPNFRARATIPRMCWLVGLLVGLLW